MALWSFCKPDKTHYLELPKRQKAYFLAHWHLVDFMYKKNMSQRCRDVILSKKVVILQAHTVVVKVVNKIFFILEYFHTFNVFV